MEFPLHVERFEELAGFSRELHLAIGMFDGVHPGHRSVIELAVLASRRSGGVSAVLTFDPHPSRLFRPDAATRLIMPVESKIAMLHALSVDIVIRKHFDRAFAEITAPDFLAHLKSKLPTLKSVCVGENFRFGKARAGSVETLIESGNLLGIDVFSLERVKHNGEPISSTRIRKELEAGEIERVNDLLGYNYCVSGKVVRGAQLGRAIGFPTLNTPWAPECRPKYGVYHVRFRRLRAADWSFGIANYGIRPTVSGDTHNPLLEVHSLTDTDIDKGDTIEVEWLRFIRAEQKFESVESLKEQISRDCAVAHSLSNHG